MSNTITEKQLVNYAHKALGHPYWYGNFGWTSTKELYLAKKKQYPQYYQWECKNNQLGVMPKRQLGVRVFDCVGLIKGAIWSGGDFDKKPVYNSKQDVSANGMCNVCTGKGKVSKWKKNCCVPEVPGILVFLPGHVGVYVGDGLVIEARGHIYGVVMTNLKDRPWTTYGYCPWVDYKQTAKPVEKPKETPVEKPTATKGYYPRYTGKTTYHIDTVFKAVDVPDKYIGSWSKRRPVAKANGIAAYVGTSAQNMKLIDLASNGKLKKV
jgi:cell wall-associated NlpC family hydrolase